VALIGKSAEGSVINPEHDTDAELERAIDFQAGLIATSLTRDEKLTAQEEMRRLIGQRSPEQVERMERARGLR
jgi:low affinity Fe/Cu permease